MYLMLCHFNGFYYIELTYPYHSPKGPYTAPAARKLEIFLDFLLMMSSSTTGHLMDVAFQVTFC